MEIWKTSFFPSRFLNQLAKFRVTAYKCSCLFQWCGLPLDLLPCIWIRMCVWVCVCKCLWELAYACGRFFSSRLQFVAHIHFIINHEMESCLTQHIMWTHTRIPSSLQQYSRYWPNEWKMTNEIDWLTDIHRQFVRASHINILGAAAVAAAAL